MVARGGYKDPGPYQHPAGTPASEYTADMPAPARAAAPRGDAKTRQVRKPTDH